MDEPFVYKLWPDLEWAEPLTLTPEAQAEVNAQLDAIAEARALAVVSASTYMVWR